jgi:hypothetical protein
VRELYGRGRFVTLDHEATLTAFENDPAGQLEALIAEGAAPLIIDEAQRSKRLALAIKAHVDLHRRMGQVLLTGSSNIFSSAEVMDSLAGRVPAGSSLTCRIFRTNILISILPSIPIHGWSSFAPKMSRSPSDTAGRVTHGPERKAYCSPKST